MRALWPYESVMAIAMCIHLASIARKKSTAPDIAHMHIHFLSKSFFRAATSYIHILGGWGVARRFQELSLYLYPMLVGSAHQKGYRYTSAYHDSLHHYT